jgi:type IV secretory pathway VirB2 component (pilin)
MQNIKKNSKKAGAGLSGLATCLSLSLAVVAMYGVMTFDAHAGGAHAGGTLCGFMKGEYQGGLGRAVATLGILIIGVAAAMGRVSATTAIVVGLGIALLGNVNATVSAFGNPGPGSCWN